jgi:hypothetical protein
MRIKKVIKIALLSVLSLVLLLALVLGVHIYQVKNQMAENANKNQLLLGRIDFLSDVDTPQAAQIATQIKAMPGIENVHCNIENDIVVYTFWSQQNTAKNVHLALTQNIDIPSKLYTVSQEQLSTGCPADVKNKSFSEHFVSGIASLFK